MTLRTAAQLGLRRLYHYQSFNADYLREVIVNSVIHFSKPSDFNDPWDCRPWFDFDCLTDPAILEQHVQWYIGIMRRHRPDIAAEQVRRNAEFFRRNPDALAGKVREFSTAMASAIDARYRVYCLSCEYDSELMWSHYAAKHQAVCLEFAVRNELFCSAFQVQYAERYPQFFMSDFAGPDEHIAPLITKSAAWSYENEFRLISDENGDPRHTIVTAGGKRAIPPSSLTAVIVGCQVSDATRESIAQMVAASPHRPLLKSAVRMPDRYGLTICNHAKAGCEMMTQDGKAWNRTRNRWE